MAKIETTLDYVKISLDKNDKQHAEIINKIDDFIESAPSKFASKDVEDRVKCLEKEGVNLNIRYATIAGGAIVAFFVINILLKHYNLI